MHFMETCFGAVEEVSFINVSYMLEMKVGSLFGTGSTGAQCWKLGNSIVKMF